MQKIVRLAVSVCFLNGISGLLQAAMPVLSPAVPSSGSGYGGTTTTFTFLVSDSDGAADVSGINAVFWNTAAPSGSADQLVCWLFYNPSNRTIYVNQNLQTWASAPIGTLPGSGSFLSGNLCGIDVLNTQVQVSGSNLSLTVPVDFTVNLGTYAPDTLSTYVRATSTAGLDTGYAAEGTWTVLPGLSPSPDFSIGMSPVSRSVQAGSSASYSISVSGFNGFNGSVSFSAALACCGAPPSPANATFDPPTVTGSGSTTLTVTTSPSTPPGNYQVIVTGASGSLTHQFGQSLTVTNGGPQISISPAAGAGSTQTFTLNVSDSSALTAVNLLFNSSLTGVNGCWLYFDPASGALWLASDDESSWTARNPGSASTLQNSQCALPANGFNATSNSGGIAITIPVTFSSAFAGSKSIYAKASDQAGMTTNYEQIGAWNVP